MSLHKPKGAPVLLHKPEPEGAPASLQKPEGAPQRPEEASVLQHQPGPLLLGRPFDSPLPPPQAQAAAG